MAEIVPIDTANRALIGDWRDIDQLPLSRFRCDGCGYGASRRVAPERCPMCGGSVWRFELRSELTGAADAPLLRDLLS